MKNKASKKNRNTVILLVAVLLAGLSLLLYPLISNYWNSIHPVAYTHRAEYALSTP